MRSPPIVSLILLFLWVGSGKAQNEVTKWYFGNNAGLDMMTTPPTVLTNGQIITVEGVASISDAAGNLLFYTDGVKIWDKTHNTMANGTGLTGNSSSTQSGIIVRKPGSSTIYYVFTQGSTAALAYSTVDMTLAGGNGSVTVKNTTLALTSTEKLTSAWHFNGTDVWVMSHLNNSTDYVSFLVTSAGVTHTPVVSSIGTAGSWVLGYLKVSPNGAKIAAALHGQGSFEICDFDNSTGMMSNPLNLGTGFGYAYGCEFSPDNTKLYGARELSSSVYQWDLCQATPSAIVASQNTVATATGALELGAFQLAPDGKIYIARYADTCLATIDNPNVYGVNCNFVNKSVGLMGKKCQLGLPNFISSLLAPPPQFTVTIGTSSNVIGCMSASFTSPPTSTAVVPGCSSLSWSVSSILWDFGDPNSGSNNNTTQLHPLHMFSGIGTYTVSMIVFYSNNTTDTVQQVLNITTPCISVKSNSITCATLGTATVTATGGLGPYSYTWMPVMQTGSVATGLKPGTYTVTVFDQGKNYTYSAQTVFNSLIPLSGVSSIQSSVTCFGAKSATGTITNFSGGSGSESFIWTNGSITYTSPVTTSLSAGLWTVTATDKLTACKVSEVFYITQPSSITINITPSSYTACQGNSISFTATATGGHAPFLFQWSGGATTQTLAVSQSSPGTFNHSVTVTDLTNCNNTQTIAVNFIKNPVFTVTNASICPLQTGTISVSGATSYTWTGGGTGNTFSHNPVQTSVYNFTGAALGCTNVGSGTIILKPIPSPGISSNSPRCNGQSLQLFATGGLNYKWDGPQGYYAVAQNPVISISSPANSGVYNVTVTSANSCTAAISHTVVVHQTPTVIALGSTVCTQSPLTFTSSAAQAASYSWTGPQGFSSFQQNPTINTSAVNMSGYYTVKVTSAPGCTNTAVAHASVVAKPVVKVNTNSPQCAGQQLVLNASGSTGGISYMWVGPNGFVATAITTTLTNVSVLESGVYTLSITTGPCISTIQQQVVVNPLPVIQLTSNSPVCEGKTLNMNADAPGFNIVGYVWNGPSAFYSVSKSPLIANIKKSNEGNYNLQVKDINNCNSSAVLPVSVLENPTITALSTTVCLNNSATVSAIGAVAYQWYGPFLNISQGIDAVIGKASFVAPQVYLVVGTAANGCTATAQSFVHTRSLPVPSISVYPRTTVCRNETVTLTGSGGSMYAWKGPDKIIASGKEITLKMISVSYSGAYLLTVTDGFNCNGSASTEIRVNELPQGTLSENHNPHCVPFCDTLMFQNPNPSAPVKVKWKLDNTTIDAKDFYHCFTRPGDYKIQALITDTITGCKNDPVFFISAYANPVADFEWNPLKPIEGDDPVIFLNKTTPDNITASWFYFDNLNKEKQNLNSSWTFNEAGIYPVAMIVTSSEGCSDTIVKNVVVEPDFAIYIPNAFTPDNNNNNEVFIPVLRAVKFFDMKVYDRWGELLFSTMDQQRGWDGTFKGEKCKVDTYVYKISLTTLNGENKSYTGTVILLQ